MNAVELIQRKRDRGVLTDEEIAWLIRSYTSGAVADYQMAAMAMAVFLNGLEPAELVEWTRAMLHSGEVLDFSDITLPKVDKHSTGGVGDKVSIPLAPMVAACGVAIPMMSGRGLGHTGGTLDKLESIPGFTTALDPGRFRQVLDTCGLVLAGQSETLVPADRKLYALRDATSTVESIPLISSSIMSKKLAEDLDGLVLDVKVGSGAFMKSREKARELARTMVGIGRAYDVKTVALLTAMDVPLGNEVGNANEIAESIAVLRGEGPADLVEVTMALGIEMLSVAGVETDPGRATTLLEGTRTSGKALEVFARVIEAQGGDPRVIEDPSFCPAASPASDGCDRGECRIPAGTRRTQGRSCRDAFGCRAREKRRHDRSGRRDHSVGEARGESRSRSADPETVVSPSRPPGGGAFGSRRRHRDRRRGT